MKFWTPSKEISKLYNFALSCQTLSNAFDMSKDTVRVSHDGNSSKAA